MVSAKIIRPDFGLYRHPDNPIIITTDNMEIFRAAANDFSCRAVIYQVPEAQKSQERAAVKKVWDSCVDPDAYFSEIDSTQYNAEFNDLDTEAYPKLAPAVPVIKGRAKIYCELTNEKYAIPQMMANWRVTEAKHEPHPFAVLNSVFFAQGTVLPLNAGYMQVGEGDILFMKPQMPHFPEFENPANKEQDRFTLAITPVTF
jgi:hypothetical protein